MKVLLAYIFLLTIWIPAESAVISGIVTDAESGQPLAQVHVRLAGTNWITATDEAGRFSFDDIPADDYSIEAAHLGYISEVARAVAMNGAITNCSIDLHHEVLSLPDVQVEISAVNGSVYHAGAIKTSQARDLGSFLETTGEAVIFDGGGAAQSRISIRGSKPGQVAVYLDGHKLNDPVTGEVDLKTIPLTNIAQVTVNPNSNLTAGSSGAGGMVELRSGNMRGMTLNGGTGSFGLKNYGICAGRNFGRHSYNFNFAQSQSAGDFKYQDAEGIEKTRLNDDYANTSVFLKHLTELDNARFEISYHHYTTDRGAPGSIENPAALDRIEKASDGVIARSTTWLKDARLEMDISYFESSTENRSYNFFGGDTIAYPSSYTTQALESDFRLTKNDSMGVFSAGLSYREDAVSSISLEGEENRSDFGGFMQRSIDYKDMSLSAVIRYDNYKDYTSYLSNMLNFRVTPFRVKFVAFSANWSKGVNLPTFNDLFYAENVFAAPNPDLKPEKTETFDFGMELNRKDYSFRAVCFNRDIIDMIIWKESFTISGRKWKPFNNDKAIIKGVELHLRAKNDDLEFNASATFSEPRNHSRGYEDNYLIFQPQVQTSESLSARKGKFSLTLGHRYLSKRYILPANTKWMDPVSIFSVSVNYELQAGIWLIGSDFRIDNLSDEDYNIVKDSPMPGRNYRITFTLSHN